MHGVQILRKGNVSGEEALGRRIEDSTNEVNFCQRTSMQCKNDDLLCRPEPRRVAWASTSNREAAACSASLAAWPASTTSPTQLWPHLWQQPWSGILIPTVQVWVVFRVRL